VYGSVLDESAVVAVGVVALGVSGELEASAPLEAGALGGVEGLVDAGGVEGLVEAGGGEVVVLAGVVLASGSVYWLSPAEGPLASAATGPITSEAASTNIQIFSTPRENTLRVLQRMRMLAFSDLHRDRRRARSLAAMATDADVVIGAGDFASMHLGLNRTIDELAAISRPLLLVPGNNERASALWRAAAVLADATVLHGEGTRIGHTEFFGLGGAVPPAPFPWSWDVTEEQAAAKLTRCPEGAVLIVHSPPKGHVDVAFGRHLGSVSILQAILTKRPSLVICGHIHQCWGQESRVGGSRVVNVGPDGRYLEV
jgi:Icc-related predicted phosphoesterase